MNEHDDDAPRQLSLLPSSAAPLQFRLDKDTRQRGLRHIAEIRLQMAQRRAEREAAEAANRPAQPRHPTAA